MSSTATSQPSAANALAVAEPMAPAPPVTTATWRARRFSALLPSFACSSDQYSMSKVSASPTGSKRPTASASSKVAAQFSAMSAAMAASAAFLPTPIRPSPGAAISRGRGSRGVLVPS